MENLVSDVYVLITSIFVLWVGTALTGYIPVFFSTIGLSAKFRDHVTLDHRIQQGWSKNLWLPVRGSWSHEKDAAEDGSNVRVILRYDFPVI